MRDFFLLLDLKQHTAPQSKPQNHSLTSHCSLVKRYLINALWISGYLDLVLPTQQHNLNSRRKETRVKYLAIRASQIVTRPAAKQKRCHPERKIDARVVHVRVILCACTVHQVGWVTAQLKRRLITRQMQHDNARVESTSFIQFAILKNQAPSSVHVSAIFFRFSSFLLLSLVLFWVYSDQLFS